MKHGFAVFVLILTTFTAPAWGQSEVIFSEDGKQVLTGSWDRKARLWTIAEPVADDVERVGEWVKTITGMRIGATGASELLTAKEWADAHERLKELGGPF